MKRCDKYEKGEQFEPLTFKITEEFNNKYIEALEAYFPRYQKEGMAVYGMLIGKSNVTQSPSFFLPEGVAAVHAREELKLMNTAWVDDEITVTWKVIDTFEKRGRFFQVKDAIVSVKEIPIIKRRIFDTFMGGEHKGQDTPTRPREIDLFHYIFDTSRPRTVTEKRINLFSKGNNIHTNLEFAKKCGLKTVAASGAMFEGYLIDELINIHGMKFIYAGSLILNFLKVVDKNTILTPRIGEDYICCINEENEAVCAGSYLIE